MKLDNLFLQNPKAKRIIKMIKNHQCVAIDGLTGSRFIFFAGNIFNELTANILLVTSDSTHINHYYEDLIRLLPEDRIMIYPEIEILPHEQITPDFTEMGDRVRVMQELVFGSREAGIILTTGTALLKNLMPADLFRELSLRLYPELEIDLRQFSRDLDRLGYERFDMVEGPGQFSIRGGIIDIFTITNKLPYRIELFGDEIDSIREFDPASQLSEEYLNEAVIPPARELVLFPDRIKERLPEIKKDYELNIKKLQNLGSKEEAEYLKERMDEALENLKELNDFPGYEQFLPYFFNKLDTLLNYLGTDTYIFLDQPEKVWKRVENYSRELGETQASLLEQGSIISSYADNFLSPEEFIEKIERFPAIFFTSNFKRTPLLRKSEEVSFTSREVEPYHGKLELFLKRVKEFTEDNYQVIITLNSISKAERIAEFLQENNLSVFFNKEAEFGSEQIVVLPETLAEGFVIEDLQLVLFTEKEVIGNPQRKRRQIKDIEQGVKISSLNELTPGDYVVHENHGIGKYLGVKTMEIQGQHQDYLLLIYSGEDKLYVPTDQVHLVQKYIGADNNPPKLYKLGGNNWKKVKQKVKNSVKEMAIGLLELYAERETVKGYSFSEDTVWQREFEEAFPYEETPDQITAIRDVKQDMEDQTPMDRLLCGDVGYGKTEVAIRAAFKTVMDGKQAAVLVPTTILAQQHYNTFKERMNNYPVNIEMISRFRSPGEQKQILKKLALGKVDIIIGTHRLLSKDVIFSELGLLIVDEEQRFGVSHKERLKDIKRNVDVLTMTATPIPRTLHMALVGVRDMSVIETPPENRYPIRTYIREFNRELIRDAINKEIGRDGQVYFVHNRVEDIEEKADMIKKLLPESRVAVAHGQMNEHLLEKLMLDFYNKEYDVLVCTTIIETGLDIPNVNTIIIDRADQMGLAQLYQLRGRVGRSNRVAYAYLLFEKDRILPEVAEKRLRAIKEFTNLGSGFKIAMRDLEIRGAGNLLGPEQHGHIASVGFSLYCKLLENAVEELKGEKEEKNREVEIDLQIDAYLPDKYIYDSKQKVEIYKKIMALNSEDEVSDLIDELVDRFGNPPETVINLIQISRIKLKCRQLGIEKIIQKEDIINCNLNKEQQELDGEKIFNLIEDYPGRIKIRSGKKPVIGLKLKSKESPLEFLEEVIDSLLESIINT